LARSPAEPPAAGPQRRTADRDYHRRDTYVDKPCTCGQGAISLRSTTWLCPRLGGPEPLAAAPGPGRGPFGAGQPKPLADLIAAPTGAGCRAALSNRGLCAESCLTARLGRKGGEFGDVGCWHRPNGAWMVEEAHIGRLAVRGRTSTWVGTSTKVRWCVVHAVNHSDSRPQVDHPSALRRGRVGEVP
jgi:hypothetical protein